MGMTATQKILARGAGLDSVQPGDLIETRLDLVLGNDITGPPAIDAFHEMGAARVFDPDKVVLVPDHFTPNKDIASARQAKALRGFAKEQGCIYFEVGRMGIEHALLPEQGLVAPGEIIVGADSHTCTYGALGAFSTGVGSTDMAACMALGTSWFRVPDAIRVVLTGEPRPYVTGKDVILHLIGLIGVDGARYMSLEFTGDGIAHLSIDSRLSMANMAIEAGAKNGFFEVDEAAIAYLAQRVRRPYTVFAPDADAQYVRTVEIDLSQVPLTVAMPSLPENARDAATVDQRIDQVVIGSCTNGREEDLRIAAELFKGRSVHPDVRCVVFPATQEIYRTAMREGWIDAMVAAGCAVSTPTCGPCLGGHCGILAEGEVCVATTNRNFVGRMGSPESKVILAGPAVAAASAVMGRVATPDQLKGGAA